MAPIDNILESGLEKELLALERLRVKRGLPFGDLRLVASQVFLPQRESAVDLERLVNQ